MKASLKALCGAAFAASVALAPMHAHALFEDNDARREILKLRTQLEELNARLAAREQALNARLEAKADKTSSLDMVGDNEKLRNELAELRGQIELLGNAVANGERRQKDFYDDLDQRLRKLEPQRQAIDGKEVDVDSSEQKTFDGALSQFKAANYAAADLAFNAFLQRYPDSGYVPQAYYWLGSTHYARRDCAKAITAWQSLANRFPASSKTPDAMLNTASCQLEMKNKRAARETLDALLKKYPNSTAATAGKERLSELK